MIIPGPRIRCEYVALEQLFRSNVIKHSGDTMLANQFVAWAWDGSNYKGELSSAITVMWLTEDVPTFPYKFVNYISPPNDDSLVWTGRIPGTGIADFTLHGDRLTRRDNKAAIDLGTIANRSSFGELDQDKLRQIINDPNNDLTDSNWQQRLSAVANAITCCKTSHSNWNSGQAQISGSKLKCAGSTPPPQPRTWPPQPPRPRTGPIDETGAYTNKKLMDVELVRKIRDTDIKITGVGLRPNTDLHVFVDESKVNQHATPLDTQYAPKQEGVVRTDAKGEVRFGLHLPAGSFRTGKLTITAIDEANQRKPDATTWASGHFHSSALKRKYQTDIVSIRPPEVEVTTTVHVQLPPPPRTTTTEPSTTSSGGFNWNDCCFHPAARVLMADGTRKKICEVKVGDVVKGHTRDNTVTEIQTPILRDRAMISVNGGWAFFSEDHPILTTEGWSSANPDNWAVKTHLIEGEHVRRNLEVGDKIITPDGTITVETIEFVYENPEDFTIYNLGLDGDHTYFVEDFCVHNKNDPLAQTFTISKEAYPNGLFLTSVDLFFSDVPEENIPVKVEVRSVVNGFPSSTQVLPFSEIFVYPEDIAIPKHTDDLQTILAAKTRVHFNAPIYLKPDTDYALVLLSNSTKYRVFLSKMGQKVIGTDRVLRQQPTLGSLFKSQNAKAWTPFQDEDLIFVLNRAKFDISSNLIVPVENRLNLETTMRYVNNVYMTPDVMELTPAVSYQYDGQLRQRNSTTYTSFQMEPLKDVQLKMEHANDWGGDFKMTITGQSTSDHVSPVIMPNSGSVTYHQNIINNMGLVADGLRITDPGSGYTSKPTITVSGGGGKGAKLEVDEMRDGQIWSVMIVEPGTGYTSKPTITVSGGEGSGCTIEYDGFEEGTGHGNAKAKYLHRPIALVDDFAAKGVRVTIDINRPKQTDVLVYVKARNEGDERPIADVPWRLVPEKGDKKFSKGDEYIETVWEMEDISYEFDGTTFTSAHEIVTKVVMVSDNTCFVPHIRDFRAVTLL